MLGQFVRVKRLWLQIYYFIISCGLFHLEFWCRLLDSPAFFFQTALWQIGFFSSFHTMTCITYQLSIFQERIFCLRTPKAKKGIGWKGDYKQNFHISVLLCFSSLSFLISFSFCQLELVSLLGLTKRKNCLQFEPKVIVRVDFKYNPQINK